jgi:hypothetical protein
MIRMMLATAVMIFAGSVGAQNLRSAGPSELARHGLGPAAGAREGLAQYTDRESLKWGKVVRKVTITAE